ncbi:hypothetical protein OIU84_017668 [Salix udensis]|uniref:Uncharacterized protein n=1 Tax=Salix udensis TaxID=889485 RepID=A0AAD6L2I5_9ROSI|nr:hypothetical protein OIU84_017668 [Salix udensis]
MYPERTEYKILLTKEHIKPCTCSAWTILSRSFAEYSVVGWDNLPRTLLLYYTNFVSSPEGYFQTVICNSEDYKNTTANHDLHYITWDTPPEAAPSLPRS